MTNEFPPASVINIIRDLGSRRAIKIKEELNLQDLPDDELCVISKEYGDYFIISINGVVKHLPTGVKLHLSEAEMYVLRNANMIEGKE
jgi:hypothetical protein